MKRILCPKCENYVIFDESKYEENKPIVLVCNHCTKQFSIRLKKRMHQTDKIHQSYKNTSTQDTSQTNELEIRQNDEGFGHITVIENGFGYKQELPLTLGDNIIGRQSKGNDIQVPIITGDPSMGRNHCIINVKQRKDNSLVYTLRDFPSLTGTFIGNKCLGKKEQIILSNGDVITIGATTFIVSFAEPSKKTEK
ncbi:FHA domain-containing protein [Parabacteroides pacaensis]|uniref:FHA domain-containing protein n=1 Tax=Parabacteroides pacaensis TaxID=2086575 RepID=UPI000D0EA262|nr:FHA domain-containing protein [Parabacteroides pacaensis]